MKKVFLKYLFSIVIVLGSFTHLFANYSQQEYSNLSEQDIRLEITKATAQCNALPLDSDHQLQHNKSFAEINESEEFEFGEDHGSSQIDSDFLSSIFFASILNVSSTEQPDDCIQNVDNFTPFRCKRYIQYEVYRI